MILHTKKNGISRIRTWKENTISSAIGGESSCRSQAEKLKMLKAAKDAKKIRP